MGHAADRKWRLRPGRRAHPVEDVFVGDHGGASRRICADVAAGNRLANLGEVLVAPDVIGMGVGVDDVADRLVGELPDLRQNLVAHLREGRVDQQHPVVSHLNGDVAAGADEHVDVPLNRQRVHLDVVEVLRLAAATRRRAIASRLPSALSLREAFRRAAKTTAAVRITNTVANLPTFRLILGPLRTSDPAHYFAAGLAIVWSFSMYSGIHRLRAASRSLGWNVNLGRKFIQKRIGPGQMMRHGSLRPVDLDDDRQGYGAMF